MPTFYKKDPEDKKDYWRDLTDWLTPVGDTIATSEWIVPDGITKGDEVVDDYKAGIWLSGGTLGEIYEVVSRITTVDGRKTDQTYTFLIEQA